MMPAYCFDSNAFIEPWKRYPVAVFPSLWDRLGAAMDDGLVIAPDEVYREIQKQEDPLYAWLKPRKRLFRTIDTPLASALTEVLAVERFARMLEVGRNQADPWVVALARVVDGGIVVSDEGRSRNPERKPKVPDVCDHFGVRCVKFHDFLVATGWRF